MSSNTTNPFGGPPPFGPPPTSNNSNNNNTAPAAESPSSVDSEAFADIDVIICGIKEDIGALLSSLQQYARKRSDGASVGLSAALDVRFHLQGQQDLDGCVRFVRTHGREMERFARSVFAGDAAKWEEDEMEDEAGEIPEQESRDVVGEDDVAGEQETLADESELAASEEDRKEYVASEDDTARVQWMEAYEAMEVAQRLETLQDNILRDIPLLSEEERTHRATLWHQMDDDHWYEVVEARLKGERFFE